MINELHKKFLKYLAVFGLVPCMEPNGGHNYYLQAFKHQNHLQQLHYHHRHLHQSQRVSQLKSNEQNRQNRLLRWQQIYTMTLIVANLIATLYGLFFFPFGDNFIVSNLVSIMVFFVQIIAVISILLETMFTYGKYYELLNNYHRVQKLMKLILLSQLSLSEIHKRQFIKYSFLIGTIHGSLLVSIVLISKIPYYGYFWYALLAIIILRTHCIQIIFYLDYIIYYLELFNAKLKALISCKIDKNYDLLDIDYANLESFDYLQNLKIIYQEIYDLHDKYNELYGTSLLCLCTVIVLDVIINMYWTFLTIFDYYESYYNYITMATLTPLFVVLFALCYTGDQLEQQVLANTATYLIILLQFRKANVSEELPNVSSNNTELHHEVNSSLGNKVK